MFWKRSVTWRFIIWESYSANWNIFGSDRIWSTVSSSSICPQARPGPQPRCRCQPILTRAQPTVCHFQRPSSAVNLSPRIINPWPVYTLPRRWVAASAGTNLRVPLKAVCRANKTSSSCKQLFFNNSVSHVGLVLRVQYKSVIVTKMSLSMRIWVYLGSLAIQHSLWRRWPHHLNTASLRRVLSSKQL